MERHLDWIIYKDLLSKVTPVHGAERLESRPFWKKHKATYTGSETVKDNGELVKRLQDKQVKQGVVYKPQILPGTLPVSRSRTCFRNSLLIHYEPKQRHSMNCLVLLYLNAFHSSAMSPSLLLISARLSTGSLCAQITNSFSSRSPVAI